MDCPLAIEEIDPKRHDRAGFDCGVEPLNRYLRTLVSRIATRNHPSFAISGGAQRRPLHCLVEPHSPPKA